MAIRQVQPHDRFPSGDSLALLELRFDPKELSARYGLSFEEGIDDLDEYQRATISLPDGSQVWLVKYRGEQNAGTTAHVDAAADPCMAKRQLLRALSLAEEDMLWFRPGVVAARGLA